MQPTTFTIESRFHPAYSLLGRWLRLRIGDRRRAESLFIVATGAIALALVLMQILAWTLFDPPELRFLIGQLVTAALYALVCLVGREPEITISVGERGLEIARRPPSSIIPWALEGEPEAYVVPFRRILRIRTIDADLYYRHHARYAGTRAFVNRIPPKLLLLELPDGPVILGLKPRDLASILRLVDERSAAATSSRVA